MSRLPALRDRMEMLTPPLPWDRPRIRECGGPLVVLLHGLWRGCRAMEPLARQLNRAGFSTLNIPYPSTRLPIPALADLIHREIESAAAARPTHWITHSLGGIIARSIIAGFPEARPRRLIMLAPPNGGSEIVDWSERHPAIHRLLGPAGRTLGTTGLPGNLPELPPDVEAAVIMGNRSSIPFFRTLLEPDNDGIVSASRGKVTGLRGYRVVNADHTFIQTHPETVRLCMEFLKSGSWEISSEAG